jgi:hypothetical protein
MHQVVVRRISRLVFCVLLLSGFCAYGAFAGSGEEPAWMNGQNAPKPALASLITENDARTATGLKGIMAIAADTGAGWTGESNFAYPDRNTRALMISIFNEKKINEKNMFQRFCSKVGKDPRCRALTGIGDNACLYTGPLRDLSLYFRKGDLTLALISPSVPGPAGNGPAPLTAGQVQAVAKFIASQLK